MLDIKYIRENADKVKENNKNRGVKMDVDRILDLDTMRRDHITHIDKLRAERNVGSKGKPSADEIKKMRELGDEIKLQDASLSKIESELNELLMKVPNIALDEVPIGPDESGNKVLNKWGDVPTFDFTVKDHVQLGTDLELLDMDRAAKVSGSRFGYWKNEAASLEFALINFVLSIVTNEKELKMIADSVEPGYSSKPFIPVIPPVFIKPELFTRAGRLSDEDKEERYYIQQDDLYLVGSAEHTLVTMHADEMLAEKELPLRYLGFSTAFRREAGSYGKDTKGMIRVHQFDKLEMESFSAPSQGLKEHLLFVAIIEHILKSLKIPHQKMLLCTGDMGKPDARQIDFESWIPSQNKYRETHTADFMTDFQSRRLNIKVKLKDGTSEFVHTNDATAIAIGRLLIAIFENFQQEDGSILIPEVLQKFMGKDKIAKS